MCKQAALGSLGILLVFVSALGCGASVEDEPPKADASGGTSLREGGLPDGGADTRDGAPDGTPDVGATVVDAADAAAAIDAAIDAAVNVPVDAPLAVDAPGDGAADTAAAEASTADASVDQTISDADVDQAIADATADQAIADATADQAPDAPPLNAGPGCVGPGPEAPLDPATEGVPARGLVLWLRGDRGVHKTTADGVCAWVDQSGRNEVFWSGTTRPVWVSAGLGGKAAIHFKGAKQGLGIGHVMGIPSTSARTIVAVTTLISTRLRFRAVFQGQLFTGGTYLGLDANTFLTAGGREGVYMMNNAYDATLTTVASPRVHVYTISTMAVGADILGAIDYRVNGAIQTLKRTSGGAGSGRFENFSGANFTVVGDSDGAEGIVSEVLFYDRALAVDERAAVEAALMSRYGIQ